MRKLTYLISALTLAIMLSMLGCEQVNSPNQEAEVEIATTDASGMTSSTQVPGHDKKKYDKDNNGFPDEGVYVNGHYTSVYAYDANGDYYWDLGDGRVQGTVGSIDNLDEETLTSCDYVVNYRADFGNDAFMAAGWIQNHINCQGYDDNGKYNYLIVHETDPRYRGNPDWAIWDTWEYHVRTESSKGNLVRPENHVGG